MSVQVPNHVAIIGQPGVGKSTIFQQLIQKEPFYGGVNDGGLERYKKTFNNYLQNARDRQLFEQALAEFLLANPAYSLLFQNTEVNNTSKIKSLLTRAQEYHVGKKTVRNEEIFLVDGGIVKTYVHHYEFIKHYNSLKNMFDTFIPDMVIYLQAPPEECLKRQQERNLTVVSGNNYDELLSNQKVHLNWFKEAVNFLENKIDVLKINNVGTVEEKVTKILSKINNL